MWLPADDHTRTAKEELVVAGNRSIGLIAPEKIIVDRMVVPGLCVTTNTDLFVPPLTDRHITDSPAFLQFLCHPLFFIGFQPDPLIDRNLLVLQQQVFQLSCPRLWWLHAQEADE